MISPLSCQGSYTRFSSYLLILLFGRMLRNSWSELFPWGLFLRAGALEFWLHKSRDFSDFQCLIDPNSRCLVFYSLETKLSQYLLGGFIGLASCPFMACTPMSFHSHESKAQLASASPNRRFVLIHNSFLFLLRFHQWAPNSVPPWS